ncbi:MAG: hypothetical protein Q4B70_09790 [Lachnospiraceae bacterium]|nr:hypothetical protein [Lachnospiraceae bacterium]
MNQERKRKQFKRKNQNITAGTNHDPGGHYFCDYSPRYNEPYDIYEKAIQHVRSRKKQEKSVVEKHNMASLEESEKSDEKKNKKIEKSVDN